LACVNGLCRTCSSDSQCKSGQACVNGACVNPPPGTSGTSPGQLKCTSSSQCGADQVCNNGFCQGCPTGQTVCNGQCVDLLTSNTNCGACGRSCVTAGNTCVAGSCGCGPGSKDFKCPFIGFCGIVGTCASISPSYCVYGYPTCQSDADCPSGWFCVT
jgi:hypothetical protein